MLLILSCSMDMDTTDQPQQLATPLFFWGRPHGSFLSVGSNPVYCELSLDAADCTFAKQDDA